MGIVANFLSVSGDELDSYINNSELLSSKLNSYFEGNDSSSTHDIDKAWEGVYFILTGQALAEYGVDKPIHPLSKAILGANILDEMIDFGYGPVQYLSVDEVKNVSDALSKITDEDVVERFDANLMEELGIYPGNWNDQYAFDYIVHSFKDLQNLYTTAVINQEALIIFFA